MGSPLLSVVIPTHNRPQFLPRAVESALGCQGPDVEVIVVPNGPDDSWKDALARWRGDQRVGVAPIATAHANAARNHGLKLAQGKYIRFLDDDDLLRPNEAAQQCRLLEETGGELCSGSIELIDQEGLVFRLWEQPATEDFVQSVLHPKRVTAINAHVYRRDALNGLWWDESIPLGQDTHWMHQLCRKREWKWVRTDAVVGVWLHHAGLRTSASARRIEHSKVSHRYLLDTVNALRSQGRLDATRADVATKALWHYIHGGFPMDPPYWTPILRAMQEAFPDTRPDLALYQSRLGRLVPVLLMESAMLPKRRLNHLIRIWRFKHGKSDAVVPP